MKTRHCIIRIGVAAVVCLLATMGLGRASTFVSGNVSGTWTKTGSPYVATGNLIVPGGLSLTIQPGVTVVMGQGLNMTVNGNIVANGTAAESITIRGTSSSQYWDKILINYYPGGPQSSFVHCNITDAANPISLSINTAATMVLQILNCSFSNCRGDCVYALALSGTASGWIANCMFAGVSNGIHLAVNKCGNCGVGGANNTVVANNLFDSLSGTGAWLDNINVGGQSNPKIVNNQFVQCKTGVRKTGSSALFNDEISYNCLYNNETNFVGYPAGVYGTICCLNARGTNCDLAYNIFVDPLFAETVTHTLAADSPCVDAGNPEGAYLDTRLPPSQGNLVNDIGLYGGPYAGNWLTNAYNGTTNFLLSAQHYAGVSIHPAAAGNYRLDYANDVTNGPWMQLTNVPLLSTPWTYIDFSSPINPRRFYRAVLIP